MARSRRLRLSAGNGFSKSALRSFQCQARSSESSVILSLTHITRIFQKSPSAPRRNLISIHAFGIRPKNGGQGRVRAFRHRRIADVEMAEDDFFEDDYPAQEN